MERDKKSSRNYARILRKRPRKTSVNTDSNESTSPKAKREFEMFTDSSSTVSSGSSEPTDTDAGDGIASVSLTWSTRLWLTDKYKDRFNPLPPLDWADADDVWDAMRKNETLPAYERDAMMFERHPHLQPRMRTILIDWLNEVCEVYKLHRETLYLAIDFTDRYLTKVTDVEKCRLQLIGVTALFIAAKAEEIYPPKLNEFSFITDGACSDEEILQQELIMLQILEWKMTPVTPVSWINVFLQTISVDSSEEKEQFLYPQYNRDIFVRVARLVDLCIMDEGSLRFPYVVITTCALALLTSELVALRASGLRSSDIEMCLKWMSHFAKTLEEEGQIEVRQFEKISKEDSHNIQTHVVSVNLLERVQAQLKEKSCSTPEQSQATPDVMMTPPKSSNSKCKSFVYSGNQNREQASRSVLSAIDQSELTDRKYS